MVFIGNLITKQTTKIKITLDQIYTEATGTSYLTKVIIKFSGGVTLFEDSHWQFDTAKDKFRKLDLDLFEKQAIELVARKI